MDRKLASELAALSELAYLTPAAVQAALPDARLVFLDRDDTQAYVIETQGMTAVAFRGTQVLSGPSLADVLSNLWIRRRPWGPGKVHAGYREAVLDLAAELESSLRAVRRPLYFTGHSMGGALATLASTLPPGPTATYTFGAPRVGNAAFAGALRNLTRVVNGDDIAPRYPLPLGFRHGGEPWLLRDDGARVRGLGVAWLLRLPVTPRTFAKAVLDHRVGEYVRKLRRLSAVSQFEQG